MSQLDAHKRVLIRFLLPLLFALASSSYSGPHVEDFLGKDQADWLISEVKNPDATGIKHLVIHDDSLSDNGNLNKNTWGFLLPHEIFYRGGFSNGPVWAEYVGKALQWTLDDYAVGGAETHDSKRLDRPE